MAILLCCLGIVGLFFLYLFNDSFFIYGCDLETILKVYSATTASGGDLFETSPFESGGVLPFGECAMAEGD